MNIRRATLEDQPELRAMAKHFIEQSVFKDWIPINEEAIADLVVAILEHGAGFVADVDGRAVGMIGLVAGPHLISRELYAEEICWWMEPAHRHGTAGPRLLRAAEEWARQNGCQCLKMVAPTTSSVGAFYKRIGFTELETAYLKRLS